MEFLENIKFWVGAVLVLFVVGLGLIYSERSDDSGMKAEQARQAQNLKQRVESEGLLGRTATQPQPVRPTPPPKEPMDWKDLVYSLGIMAVIIAAIRFLAYPILQSFLDKGKS